MTPVPVAAGQGMILMPVFANTVAMTWRISERSLLMRTGAIINRPPDKISTELLQKTDRCLLRNRGFLWKMPGVGKLDYIGLLLVGQWPILCL
jgi:hypothetical protein